MKTLGILGAIAALVTGVAIWAAPTHAATNRLNLEQSCLADGSVRVKFSWQGNDPAATQQWLDLSLFNNDWQWGTFLGAGPMAGNQQTLTWDGLIPDATHYVRLNQQFGSGFWDPSPTFYFNTRSCAPTSQPNPPVNDRKVVPAPIEDVEVVKISDVDYQLQVTAGLPSGCALRDRADMSINGGTISVRVTNTLPVDNRPCTLIYGYYDLYFDLGDLQEGATYQIVLNDTEVVSYTP